MTSPIPGPSSNGAPQQVPAPSAAPGFYAPQGEVPAQGAPASYVPNVPTPLGTPQGAPHQATSYSAPTGEGWSGRSLSESEQRTQESLLALKAEIGKAVVGQDGAITGLIVALVAAWSRPAGGCARRREDAARAHPRPRPRRRHGTHPVHSRPHARGHHGFHGVGCGPLRVRVP